MKIIILLQLSYFSSLDSHHHFSLSLFVLLQLLAAAIVRVSTSHDLLFCVGAKGKASLQLGEPLDAEFAVIILEGFEGFEELIARAN
jgi:hypothetical protein